MMDDLTITRLCAETMGIPVQHLCEATGFPGTDRLVIIELSEGQNETYDPLHDDAQAMALVRAMELRIRHADDITTDQIVWAVESRDQSIYAVYADLNRAICLCVASLQSEK